MFLVFIAIDVVLGLIYAQRIFYTIATWIILKSNSPELPEWNALWVKSQPAYHPKIFQTNNFSTFNF